MKKLFKSIIIIVLSILLIGCTEDKKEEEVKIEFTEEITNYKGTISYKLPIDHETNYSYQDKGVNVIFSIDQLEEDNQKLREFDKQATSIEEKTINGIKYEYYKIKYSKEWIIYIYRTKLEDNTYYLFKFNAYANKYDDLQIEAFMNTVEYKN